MKTVASTTLALSLVCAFAFAAEASATITPTSTGSTVAGAMNATSGPVTTGTFPTLPPPGENGEIPNAVSTSPLAGFPESGSTNYGLLTTGDPLLADDANTDEGSGLEYDGANPVRGDSDYDVSVLDLTLNVPAVSNPCVNFDFRFFSEEYPEFVGSEFNDAFIAELDPSTPWTTDASDIVAPDNFAKDTLGNPITINATGPSTVSPVNAAGTTYDAATQRLKAARSTTSGTHHLILSIFDQGDGVLDSAAFVDNVRVVSDAVCATGVAAAGTPPDTQAVTGSVGGNSATFTWGGSGSFVCQLHFGPVSDEDKAEPFLPCTSPYVVNFDQPEGFSAVGPKLEEGVHTLSVSAVNSSGDADQTPSTFEFSVTPGGGPGETGGGTTAPAPTKAKKCKKKKGKKAQAAKKCKKKKKK